MRVATLVFLFLARIRFPKTGSIPSIIRRRYGDKVLREVLQFEKLDYKLRKKQLDLDCFYVNVKTVMLYLNFRIFFFLALIRIVNVIC